MYCTINGNMNTFEQLKTPDDTALEFPITWRHRVWVSERNFPGETRRGYSTHFTRLRARVMDSPRKITSAILYWMPNECEIMKNIFVRPRTRSPLKNFEEMLRIFLVFYPWRSGIIHVRLYKSKFWLDGPHDRLHKLLLLIWVCLRSPYVTFFIELGFFVASASRSSAGDIKLILMPCGVSLEFYIRNPCQSEH